MAPERVRISVTCLAEFITSYGRSSESILRPFKFNTRGEGFARSRYYQHAIATIRNYHSGGNDAKILDSGLLELRARMDKAAGSREQRRLSRNISAIEAYRKVYEGRVFKVLPNHRISYRVGQIVVTAQPDLWVEESGTEVLLKIGIAKKKPSYVDILLTVIRKAAVSSGHRVHSKNIVYLEVTSGRELVCKGSLTHLNRTFQEQAREIAAVWPKMKQP